MAFSGALLHNTKLLCDQHCKDKVVLFFAAKFPQIHNNIAPDLSIAIKSYFFPNKRKAKQRYKASTASTMPCLARLSYKSTILFATIK